MYRFVASDWQVSSRSNRTFERMFYLFSDILLYAKPRLPLEGFQICCILPLHHCVVTRVFGQQRQAESALFTVKTQQPQFTLVSLVLYELFCLSRFLTESLVEPYLF